MAYLSRRKSLKELGIAAQSTPSRMFVSIFKLWSILGQGVHQPGGLSGLMFGCPASPQ